MEETENCSNRLVPGITDSPRGTTLSTSTSSFEALDPHDSNLSRLATKAFDRTSTYITHELNTSIDDYKLLENMNRATIAKYSDMQQISENLATSSVQLKEKFDNLVSFRSAGKPINLFSFPPINFHSFSFRRLHFTQLPYLEQIDDIEKTVDKLEDCAYQLDAYSQKLELKFNNLLKKK